MNHDLLSCLLKTAAENGKIYAMKTTCTMPSANGVGAVKIEKILDEELGTKCGFIGDM